MKKTLLSVMSILGSIGILSLNSCSKQDYEKLSTNLESTSTKNGDISVLSAGDNQYDLLGYGYDITGRYANSESAKLQVIDINKFVSQDPSDYDVNTNVEQYFEYYGGSNAHDYADTLSVKYKQNLSLTDPIFTAEITENFNTIGSFSSKYAYATINLNIKQKRLRIFSNATDLRNNYLTDKFKSDVNSLSPADLVQKYGTHVLTNITLGAKFSVNYRTQTNNSSRKEAVTAGVNFSGLFNVFGMNLDVKVANSEANSNFDQTLFYRTSGGDGTKGLIGEISLDSTAPKLSIANWQSTCTRDNAVLIDIDRDGFIPLEELITDPAKKAAVKSYIVQYIKQHQVQMYDDDTVPVYLYYSDHAFDHYTTLDANVIQKYGNEWNLLGRSFSAFSSPVSGTIPIYEFYDTAFHNHLTTSNRNETDGFPNWVYQGISFYAYDHQVAGSIPIYMFYNKDYNHYITPDRNAVDGYPNWEYRGIVFYALP